MKHDYARLVEENGAEFLLAMGRAGGAEEKHTAYIHWIIGSCPIAYHNAVVRAALPPDLLEAEVAASIACLEKYHTPGSWHAGPAMAPADIGRALLAHGFRPGGDDIGMAVDFSNLPESVEVPPGFTIQRVQNPSQLDQWRAALGSGFGEGPEEARWAAEMFARLGYTADSPWQHYLGLLHGEPVGTSSLFLNNGAAGIYFVSTVPEARRQGIGAAVTLAPLQAARRLGYSVGVLGASEMGYGVYRRLGFAEVCRIEVYEYSPSA